MATETEFRVPRRAMGSQGLVISSQGLGTMGMTIFYGDNNPLETEEESIQTIGRAIELGINFFDTAWIYQHGPSGATNEGLLGKAIARYGRENFAISTKYGLSMEGGRYVINNSAENIRAQLAQSLERLGTDYVDLYLQNRTDPNTPVETVMETMRELVQEGKVRYVGLSECTPDELRRAHAVFPITAIEMEWSLQTRDIEDEIIPLARELGVAIIAYSPLGRGMLSQRITTRDELPENDWRRTSPRFNEENFEKNAAAARRLAEIAARKGCTAGQLALAWVHSRGDFVFPIPGTRNSRRLEENARASTLELTEDELREIEEAVPVGAGNRYAHMNSTWNARTSA